MYFSRIADIYLRSSQWFNTKQTPLAPHSANFEWDTTPAHKHLVWHDCFEKYKCARLQVPMDWRSNTSEANKTVELALIKIEATVPVTDRTYGGAIVLNPGGPGGSGVATVLSGGYNVQTIVSAGPNSTRNNAKHFDIISFDPRGVNNSRPLMTCFPNHQEASAWQIETGAHGKIDTSDTSFDYIWASQRALADECSRRLATEGIAKHMSTAPVARDVVEIAERHGEWRAREAKRLISKESSSHQETFDVIKQTEYKPGKERVQYWGFSYGTVLGATLLAMFPDRMGPTVLDGVVDSYDYMTGGWQSNLYDTDRLADKFAEYCFKGGSKNCAVHHVEGPSKILSNIKLTLTDLNQNPIPVPATSTGGPRVITYNDVVLLIRQVVYSPLIDFPKTALILHELSTRNTTTLLEWKDSTSPPIREPLHPKCHTDGPYSPSCFRLSSGRTIPPSPSDGILCTDAPLLTNTTKSAWRQRTDFLFSQSKLLGASWAEIAMACTNWHARPAWRYEGDFNFGNRSREAVSDLPSPPPPLFVGNAIDPVTPLRNAYKMAAGFEGAAVLRIDAEGHCSRAGVSMCAAKAIREYFQRGVVRSASCGVDRRPLDGYRIDVPLEEVKIPAGETDEALWRALIEFNRAGN